MENGEKKYEDVIKALEGLQEVKAPANFEADLKRRINQEKFSKEEKKSFWQNIFVPARLIPSLGLVSAAVVIFFVVETSSEEIDNPFLIEPRVREDIIPAVDYREPEKKREEISESKSLKGKKLNLEERKNESELKSSDDKMIMGKEKSGEVEGIVSERDFVKDQDLAESVEMVSDSNYITANLKASTVVVDSSGTSSGELTGQVPAKDELNFRQIQPSMEEQRVINQLKMQVQSLEKTDKTQK